MYVSVTSNQVPSHLSFPDLSIFESNRNTSSPRLVMCSFFYRDPHIYQTELNKWSITFTHMFKRLSLLNKFFFLSQYFGYVIFLIIKSGLSILLTKNKSRWWPKDGICITYRDSQSRFLEYTNTTTASASLRGIWLNSYPPCANSFIMKCLVSVPSHISGSAIRQCLRCSPRMGDSGNMPIRWP